MLLYLYLVKGGGFGRSGDKEEYVDFSELRVLLRIP
jgi:hypothetical protein